MTPTLYLRGHRFGAVLLLLGGACLGALSMGTTAIPLPWMDGVFGAAVPFNAVFALLFTGAIMFFFTSDLAAWEERGVRAWRRWDYLFLCGVFAPLILLAALGDLGLWQFSALSLACFFTLCLVLPALQALSVSIFIVLAQCLLVAVVPVAWVPLFWEPTVSVCALATIYSLAVFAFASSPLKRTAGVK